jgi:hypothetical protein
MPIYKNTGNLETPEMTVANSFTLATQMFVGLFTLKIETKYNILKSTPYLAP